MLKLAIFTLLCMFGCGGSGGGGVSQPLPVIPASGPPYIAYSLPNAWHLADATQLCTALASASVNATEIEWTPFYGSPIVCDGSTDATYPAAAQGFATVCAKAGVTVFVSIANMNGCATTRQSDQWFLDQLQAVQRLPGHVVLIPVSEPWNAPAKSKHWAQLALERWAGEVGLPWDKGGAVWPDLQSRWLDKHENTWGRLKLDLGQPEVVLLYNTDSTATGRPTPGQAKDLTDLARGSGANLFFYDWQGQSPDFTVIEAMAP